MRRSLPSVSRPGKPCATCGGWPPSGLLCGHGYYDAIDFSRQPGRAGGRGVIVQACMAHHQGMGFLSLANFLLEGAVRRSFHADGRVRAVEPLLHERVPVLPSLHHISTRERARGADSVGEVAPSTSTFDTAHTRTPKTQLLSNGRYSVMLTNSGGGYSQWGAEEITRWRSDPTRDPWGTFLYIHEPESGETWSAAFQPCGGAAESYSASFSLDRASSSGPTTGSRHGPKSLSLPRTTSRSGGSR